MCGAFSTTAIRAGAQGPARTKCSVSLAIAEKQEFHFEKLFFKKKKKALFFNKPAVCSSPRGKAETRISAIEMPDSVFKMPLLALP